MSGVVAVFLFAILNEALIEYWLSNIQILRPYLRLISLGIALFLTFLYRVSLFSLAFGTEITSPILDYLLSAFIIARVSNYLNDFAQKVLRSK